MAAWIDLHTHSTFSDGSMSPSELVRLAVRANLAALSLTDHDTVAGIPEFLAAAPSAKLDVLTGLEMSVEIRGRTVHMLGYGIDPAHEGLRRSLRRFVDGRNDRNERMIRKLQMLGVGITIDEVKAFAGDQVVGRPHVAQALIRKGVVDSFDEAFERFLARGAPAYCERYRPSPEDAIALIDDAGGVSVLAHPYLIRAGSPDALASLVARLKNKGLAGIEAYYSEHDDEQTRQYLDLAKRFDLLVTGGTDYHGSIKPDIELGRGRGSLGVPYVLFEILREAIEARPARRGAVAD